MHFRIFRCHERVIIRSRPEKKVKPTRLLASVVFSSVAEKLKKKKGKTEFTLIPAGARGHSSAEPAARVI